MTSAKYYSNWVKEAGRGHISAILAWGGFALYLIFKVMSLSIDTDFAFSGIGSAELSYLCMGLGILLAFSEFGYLFQAKKQDFYFSLPVKRSTIFWTHYFHGLLHFAFPFLITQAACALYQASRDTVFASYASGYTVRSVIVFLLVFLLFYHMGLLAAAVSGRVAFAVAVLAVLLFYFEILIQYVLLGMSQRSSIRFTASRSWKRPAECWRLQGLQKFWQEHSCMRGGRYWSTSRMVGRCALHLHGYCFWA